MKLRTHAAVVIGRRRLKETLIQPGYYISVGIGLFVALVLQKAFVESVGTGGFDASLNRIYEMISRVLEGAFGETVVEKLFADGPYLLALWTGFVPVYIFVIVSSLFRTGMERQVGALELLSAGPADGTACYIAAFLRDMVLIVISLIVLFGIFVLGSLAHNLAITQRALAAFPQLLLVSLLLCAYGMMIGASVAGPIAALVTHLGVTAIFILLIAAKYAIVSGGIGGVATVAGAVLDWISPLHYLQIGTLAVEGQNWTAYVLSLSALGLLSVVAIVISHAILRKGGVRA